MDRNLSWKFILITGLVVLACWTLYPPNQTLKQGIDLGGGTSLIYEIDTKGLTSEGKRGLAERMITVLRRRIDPANIQNLVWRPLGSARFEIQMPLASKEARDKRQDYEIALNNLLADNITTAAILRSVEKQADQRAENFARFAGDSNDRMKILDDFAKIYDLRKELQKQRDDLAAQLKTPESLIKMAGFNLDDIQTKVPDWAKLDPNDPNALKSALLSYPGAEGNLDLLTRYTDTYRKWAEVVDKLTDPDPETGVNAKYALAIQSLHKLNLSQDQINAVLEMSKKESKRRIGAIDELKKEFPERSTKIDQVVKAYDEYFPFRGRLDDPADIQRMLKGAGILEFRILPTEGHPDVDMAKMRQYVETLKTKGPKYASDNQYVWLEIENPSDFRAGDGSGRPALVAQFGGKSYVLASNKKDEAVLHTGQTKDWRLVRSSPGNDQQGRRAIDFELDERGGLLFSRVTGKNIERPLCILLDNLAISAPKIQSQIYTRGQITGSFTQTEVDDMVNKLNAGSLPARLIEQPISVKTIGPSIGADNRDRGIKAGIIGVIGVIFVMLVYYTLAGSIADIALLMNLLFTLAIMAGLNATFTLPGIAGLILTIGMSVDANVLISERMREEQQRGASLAIAIKNGYDKAFSAIFDSNLTTIMTAAILYWVASEEIKGFAITLIIGLASSMFTALFVTRACFDWLLKHRIIKDHIVMLRLIQKPNIDWMKYRPVFFVISGILAIGGLAIFFSRGSEKYDIEFTGGTSVQVDFKQDVSIDRQQVEDIIHKKGQDLKNDAIASATVYSVGSTGRQYEIITRETNKTVASLKLPDGNQMTADQVIEAIKKAQTEDQAELGNLVVTGSSPTFNIRTIQPNQQTVADVLAAAFPGAEISDPQIDAVVTNVVLSAFGDKLEIQQNLEPNIVSAERITDTMTQEHPELLDFLNGVAIKCDIQKSASPAAIDQRFRSLRFKPDMQKMNWYQYKILGTNYRPFDSNTPVNSFIYVSAESEAAFSQLSQDVFTQFADNEKIKVLAAAELETSLSQVTQIAPSVGEESQRQALVAIVLSLIAMLIYLAFRFGDLRYGIGAVVKLTHDTCVTLGLVSVCVFIAATSVGQALLIGDFKIDMTIVAAFLTLLGYSINDSIVIYDRIRENKRHLAALTPQLINNSINECMSRTLLTGTTTLLVLLIMYIFSGKGLRGFNFVMLFGIVVGTYSSVAISVPILLLRIKTKTDKKQ
jgi:SecD/SecF fusion protein